jgi:hypothetical protein
VLGRDSHRASSEWFVSHICDGARFRSKSV